MDPEKSYEEQKAWYEKEYGIIFLECPWSLWHIRVWTHSRISNGMGVQIESGVVFRYAEKFGMDDINTLEVVKHIERGANSRGKRP